MFVFLLASMCIVRRLEYGGLEFSPRLSIPETQSHILFSHGLVDSHFCFLSMKVGTVGAEHNVGVLVGAI